MIIYFSSSALMHLSSKMSVFLSYHNTPLTVLGFIYMTFYLLWYFFPLGCGSRVLFSRHNMDLLYYFINMLRTLSRCLCPLNNGGMYYLIILGIPFLCPCEVFPVPQVMFVHNLLLLFIQSSCHANTIRPVCKH